MRLRYADVVVATLNLRTPNLGQDSLIEIEDDEGGEAYGGKEGMSASVIAGHDTSLVFEFSEHALDLFRRFGSSHAPA